MPSPFGSIPVTSVNATGNINVDSLLALPKWGGGAGAGATLEYSFPGAGATWAWFYGDGEPSNGFAPLNAEQQVNDLGSTVILQGSTDTDRTAEFEIEVSNFTGIFAKSDFLL